MKITRRHKVILLVGIVLFGFLVLDPRFLGTAFSPDTGGLCFVSQMYGPDGNTSYSTIFLGVNFTFLYWTYPSPTPGPNGTLIYITDQPYKVHILVTFSDGIQEDLSIYVNGYIGIHIFQIPFGARTNHTNPGAGVITANTSQQWSQWQYTVVIIG